MASPSNRRLQKEMSELNLAFFKDLKVDETNMYLWKGVLVPDAAPYKKGAFRIDIQFPVEYPFKPPTLTFRTKIYHPNIDEKGHMCLPMIDSSNWKPATTISAVLEAVFILVNCPDPLQPLRPDVAKQYLTDPKSFKKTAEQHTLKYAEKLN